jgi:hypothetical protein
MAKKLVEEPMVVNTPIIETNVETPIVETPVEEVVENVIPTKVEKNDSENILKMIDELQTIEMGKLEVAKELIKNSQYLEAITILKSIQTLEHGKVQDIVQRIGQ